MLQMASYCASAEDYSSLLNGSDTSDWLGDVEDDDVQSDVSDYYQNSHEDTNMVCMKEKSSLKINMAGKEIALCRFLME